MLDECGGNPYPETHFALAVEPSGAVAPGDELRLIYRPTNGGAALSGPARVRFLLPPEAIAVDAVDIAVAPPEPLGGADGCVRVRIVAPLDDATLTFQAVLSLADGAQFGTNAVTVEVRSAPCLFGPQTFATLQLGERDGEAVVGVAIGNAGNGPACGLRVVLPAPDGTRPCDGDAVTAFEIPRIEAGDTVRRSYHVTALPGGSGALRVEDAYIVAADGARTAIAPSAVLLLPPALALHAPAVTVAGPRAGFSVSVVNSGSAPAAPVLVDVAWPPGWCCVPASVAVDGMPAATRAARGAVAVAALRATGMTLRIERVAAGASCVVTGDLYAGASAARGELRAELADTAAAPVSVALPQARKARLVLEARDSEMQRCTPGTSATFEIVLTNGGDAACSVRLAADGIATPLRVDGKAAGEAAIVVGAGRRCHVTFTVPVPLEAQDGDVVHATLTAHGGDEVVRIGVRAVARERAWFDLAHWLARDGGAAALVLRHCGSTPARDLRVRLACGTMLPLGDVAPGETLRVTLDCRFEDAARGGTLTDGAGRAVALPPRLPDVPCADVDAQFEIADAVPAGIAFPVRFRLSSEAPIETLVIRIAGVAAPPVRGSTTVNGHALHENEGDDTLAGSGLTIRRFPAGAVVNLAWLAFPDPALPAGAPIAISAVLDVDGSRRSIPAPPVHALVRPALAARPAGVPFFVDGLRAIADGGAPCEPQPPAEEPEPAPPLTFILPLDETTRAGMVRLLRGAMVPGLIAHVLSIRALFPQAAPGAAPELHAAVNDAAAALRAILDRLFVKVRIPGYDAGYADCEDLTARDALVHLTHATATAGDAPHGALEGLHAVARVSREDARSHARTLERAALGAPAALAAWAAFLPTHSDDPEIGAALHAYVEALQSTFAAADAAAPGRFEHRLAFGDECELDRLRDRLIGALAVPARVRA